MANEHNNMYQSMPSLSSSQSMLPVDSNSTMELMPSAPPPMAPYSNTSHFPAPSRMPPFYHYPPPSPAMSYPDLYSPNPAGHPYYPQPIVIYVGSPGPGYHVPQPQLPQQQPQQQPQQLPQQQPQQQPQQLPQQQQQQEPQQLPQQPQQQPQEQPQQQPQQQQEQPQQPEHQQQLPFNIKPTPIVVPRARTVSVVGAIILSCITFWLCGFLFGGIAFLLATVGQSSAAAGDSRGAIQMRNASYGFSTAGIIIGVIVIGVVGGLYGSATLNAQSHPYNGCYDSKYGSYYSC